METVGILIFYLRSMVAHTANKTAALYQDVHRLRYKEFHTATEGMYLYLLILSNGGISQVHSDTAAESIETGTMKWLAAIDVLIATIVNATADALTIFTNRQRTLEPLVWVTPITVDNKDYAYVYQQTDTEICNPWPC